jgi:predicted RNA binding protein YcfA (HicA-like mRNA interferase family)
MGGRGCIALNYVYNIHMDSKEIIRRLEKEGWVRVAQKGSHAQYKHPERKGRVTIPHPRKDIKPATLHSIEKQAGWR